MSGVQKRISIALLFGAVIIAGALLLRAGVSPSSTSSNIEEGVTVTAAPARSAIEVLDENNDGVPDWQETLLVTEAIEIASTTDTFKEPETLTEKFALDFFQDIVRAKNYGTFGDTPEELVFEASDRLSQDASDILLGSKDITTNSDNSAQALSEYGEKIAFITTLYPDTSEDNETAILERALRNQNPQDLEILDVKIEVYGNILSDTLALTVPSGMAKEHLDLVNSYTAILNDITAMRNAFTDPMYTLLRMKRYQEDTQGLGTALGNLYKKLLAAGAGWEEGSPVFLFIPSN